jgi:murein DD-endopeptidase MepM/ murein hydrolase activator NlpD
MDIAGGRYLVLAHLKQGSVTVHVGDAVRRGQPLAAVGNSGHTNEPHLHAQIPGLGDRHRGRRPYLPHRVPQRPHHQGRCLAMGRHPRTSHRRPRQDTRAVRSDRRAAARYPQGRDLQPDDAQRHATRLPPARCTDPQCRDQEAMTPTKIDSTFDHETSVPRNPSAGPRGRSGATVGGAARSATATGCPLRKHSGTGLRRFTDHWVACHG